MAKGIKNTHAMIRMDEEVKRQIDDAAERLGVTRAAFIYMSIKYYLSQTKGGKLPIPN